MKKSILGVILGLFTAFFLFVVPVQAQMGMMGNYDTNDSSSSSQTEQQNQQKLNTMVNELLKAQNVSSVRQLDCKKISNDEFEKLGDAWMDGMVPNEARHQAMDTMMGGEGSQSLTNAHIGMAENYLGCSNDNANDSWMPMMFGAYNNVSRTSSRGGAFPMMGWGYGASNMVNGSFWGVSVLALLFWLVAFIDLILLGIFLWKRIRR